MIYRPRKSAELSDVSCPTLKQLLFKLRTRIAQLCDASSPFSGEVGVDESYVSVGAVFGGRKGAGPGVKRLSSGFWNATKRPLQAVIWDQVTLDSIIHLDGWGLR